MPALTIADIWGGGLMEIINRAGAAARDGIRWRHPITGAILAGGMTWAGVAAGPAMAADSVSRSALIDVTSPGTSNAPATVTTSTAVDATGGGAPGSTSAPPGPTTTVQPAPVTIQPGPGVAAPGDPFTISPAMVTPGPATPGAPVTVQNFGTLAVVLLPPTSPNGGSVLVTVPTAAGLSGPIAVSAARTASFISSGIAFDRITDVRNAIRQNSPAGAGSAAMAYAQEPARNDPLGRYVRGEAAAPPAGAGGPKPAAWIRGYGDYEQRDAQASFSLAGAGFTSNLGYRQATGGVIGGIDAVWSGLTTANDGLVLGLLGGYTRSRVDLRGSPTTQTFSGPSAGAYGTYLRGNGFFDLLLKADLLSLDINIPGISQSANLTNYSVAANVGYKFDLPNNYYVEPTAGLDYVRTAFDQASALTATTVALSDGDALRARAGARVGTEWIAGNVRVEPSLLGQVYEITNATNSAVFANAASVSMPSDVGRARGEFQGMLNVIHLDTGLAGFARVDTRFGEGLWGVGGKAGMRYQW